ncbi:MAG: type II toxin-antitoxin system Phd/YefM family antitoxin [Deltaproteobacteria bacterium]|nr:type II toxin-antitoxin system Phd/YefM family antitoxin [Deltaproteobacteria bacterium]
MKRLNVSEDIIPLGQFKARAARIIKDLADRANPLVITQNGRPAFVVMSPAEFDRMRERQAFLEAVAQGLADVEAGRVISDEDLRKQIDDE